MGAKPHIVHIVSRLSFGGSQRSTLYLATSDVLSRYKQSIVCISQGEEEFYTEAFSADIAVYYCPIDYITIENVPFSSYRLKRLIQNFREHRFERNLLNLLEKLNVNLVHSQIPNVINRQASVVLEQLGRPWIFTLRGIIGNGGYSIPGFDETLRLVARSEKARIVCVSQAVYDSMIRRGISIAGKSRVIYNGIDRNRFRTSHLVRDMVRQQWLLPSTAVVFGTANRLVPLKRIDLAIAAFAQIAATHNDTYFMIAGDGPLLSELQRQVKHMGLNGRVRFVGFQKNMNEFLNGLDVFVLTSDTESFSNVVLEAQALQLPCIATAVGGVPEVLGEAGILIKSDSVDDLVKAMGRMLSPQQRAIYAEKSKNTAEKFDIDNTAAQYAALYNELLSRSAT